MTKTARGKTPRAKIGDVLEIKTTEGLAYFQYTHQHPVYGGLIRVLPGLYAERPAHIAILVAGAERYFVFFPVRAAAARDLVRIVGSETIPDHARAFPMFRTGRPGNWWLWDGETEWRVEELTPAQHSLPIRMIWNDTMLASRIASGWTPEDAGPVNVRGPGKPA
jgi:hypothetical protein